MNKVHKTPMQCQWEKIHTENYMYIQHALSEITKNHICVSILHWPRLQNAGTGTRKRRIKLKPFFSMHVVIYTVAVVVKIKIKIKIKIK